MSTTLIEPGLGYVDLNGYYLEWPGDILLTGDDAVNESIRNILTVYPGSLIFNRTFGSELIKLVHEPMSVKTAGFIQLYAILVVDRYEPRVPTIPGLGSVTPDYV